MAESKSIRAISTIRYFHLGRLFDDDSEIEENYRHPQLRYKSGLPMELDIFLPKEQLAFEYQGEHHFKDVYHLGTLWQQKQRDEEKRISCMENEITLIEVPYWWNKETSSLASTIHKRTKGTILSSINGAAQPIPSTITHDSQGDLTISSNGFLNQYSRSTFDAWNRMEWNGRSKWMVNL